MMNQEFDDNPQPKRQQMTTRTPQFTEQKDVEDTPSDAGSQMDLDPTLGETEYKMEIDESGPEALPMRYLSTKKYSTTSSVYASDTIGAPDINQILFWFVLVLPTYEPAFRTRSYLPFLLVYTHTVLALSFKLKWWKTMNAPQR